MNAHEKSMDYFIELLRKDTVSFILLIRFRKTLLSIEKKTRIVDNITTRKHSCIHWLSAVLIISIKN
jgi:hypothetical protein